MMSKTISAAFETRQQAQTTVEHLVQEHNLPADAVEIIPASAQNSAGTIASGSDHHTASQQQLDVNLVVVARIDISLESVVKATFETYGGKPIA